MLAITGFVIGLRFRLKVFLPVLVFLLICSVIFAILEEWDLFTTFLAIVTTQTILQVGYFLGVLVRSAMIGRRNKRSAFLIKRPKGPS
jgi:hypothetical protein